MCKPKIIRDETRIKVVGYDHGTLLYQEGKTKAMVLNDVDFPKAKDLYSHGIEQGKTTT